MPPGKRGLQLIFSQKIQKSGLFLLRNIEITYMGILTCPRCEERLGFPNKQSPHPPSLAPHHGEFPSLYPTLLLHVCPPSHWVSIIAACMSGVSRRLHTPKLTPLKNGSSGFCPDSRRFPHRARCSFLPPPSISYLGQRICTIYFHFMI